MPQTEFANAMSNDDLVTWLKLEERKNSKYRRNRGIYDYETFLGIRLTDLVTKAVNSKGSFCWYDMCCGTGEALAQLMRSIQQSPYLQSIEARGIDLITDSNNQVLAWGEIISQGNIADYPFPAEGVDLVTCVEGLYLVEQYLGFVVALQTLEHWYAGLKIGGLLAIQNSAFLQGYAPLNVLAFLRTWADQTSNCLKSSQGGESGRRYDDNRYIQIYKMTNEPLHFPAVKNDDPHVIQIAPQASRAAAKWWEKFE